MHACDDEEEKCVVYGIENLLIYTRIYANTVIVYMNDVVGNIKFSFSILLITVIYMNTKITHFFLNSKLNFYLFDIQLVALR